jgi:hypothetical protein
MRMRSLVDGKVVCARRLVNRMTIQHEKGAVSVEYFHEVVLPLTHSDTASILKLRAWLGV